VQKETLKFAYDAVQLASAVYAKADLFITNDDGLSRLESEGCRVVLLNANEIRNYRRGNPYVVALIRVAT